MTLTITGADGKLPAGAKVKASVAMTSMDMGTTRLPFPEISTRKYQGSIVFGMAGPWRITLTITAPGEKPLTLTRDSTVSP